MTSCLAEMLGELKLGLGLCALVFDRGSCCHVDGHLPKPLDYGLALLIKLFHCFLTVWHTLQLPEQQHFIYEICVTVQPCLISFGDWLLCSQSGLIILVLSLVACFQLVQTLLEGCEKVGGHWK